MCCEATLFFWQYVWNSNVALVCSRSSRQCGPDWARAERLRKPWKSCGGLSVGVYVMKPILCNCKNANRLRAAGGKGLDGSLWMGWLGKCGYRQDSAESSFLMAQFLVPWPSGVERRLYWIPFKWQENPFLLQFRREWQAVLLISNRRTTRETDECKDVDPLQKRPSLRPLNF